MRLAEALTFDRTAKDSFRERAVGVREAGPHQSLHCRTAADLVLPPDGAIRGSLHFRAFPFDMDYGLPDCYLLRAGRHLALLDASRLALGSVVQEHS